MEKKGFDRKDILTVPNAMSAFRIVCAVLFYVMYDAGAPPAENLPALICLALNGLSDLLDGKIARRFGLVSEFGKLLDPAADYATKFFLILSLAGVYSWFPLFLAVFAVRAVLVTAAGADAVKTAGHNDGAIFAGKADTTVFYAVMALLVLFPGIPRAAAFALTCASAAMMVWAAVSYLYSFSRMKKDSGK